MESYHISGKSPPGGELRHRSDTSCELRGSRCLSAASGDPSSDHEKAALKGNSHDLAWQDGEDAGCIRRMGESERCIKERAGRVHAGLRHLQEEDISAESL